MRYTQRLDGAGAVASVGSTGDSYDNALAETFNSQLKAELVRNRGPGKSIDDLEIAIAEYIHWFNHRRLTGEMGLVPTVENEQQHHQHPPVPTTAGASVQSLHQTRLATGSGYRAGVDDVAGVGVPCRVCGAPVRLDQRTEDIDPGVEPSPVVTIRTCTNVECATNAGGREPDLEP